jgi:hypothetical protein
MPQIDIDFEVFKQLTNRRETEETTYNDVIRSLLDLPKAGKSGTRAGVPGKAWVVSNTSFPAGSEFLAEYKGVMYSAVVKNSKLELDGHRFSTPSAAAMHITGGNVNGWRFWKCKVPGSTDFVPIDRLRGRAHY